MLFKALLRTEAPSPAPSDCPHDDWIVYGSNSIGYGTCKRCEREVGLEDLLNNWKARMEKSIADAIERMEKVSGG